MRFQSEINIMRSRWGTKNGKIPATIPTLPSRESSGSTPTENRFRCRLGSALTDLARHRRPRLHRLAFHPHRAEGAPGPLDPQFRRDDVCGEPRQPRRCRTRFALCFFRGNICDANAVERAICEAKWTRSSTLPPNRTSTVPFSSRKSSCAPTFSARTCCSKPCGGTGLALPAGLDG